MASGTEVQGLPVTRLPPHLEGNLIYHRPTKFGRPKRAFFVLLETVILQYESKDSYHKGQRSKENFKINLEEVCGITEILMSNKQYKNCSFKLTLNDKEATEYKFSAESRQAMEKWVNGLRDAKEFWIQHHKRLEFTQKRSNGPHINEPETVHNEADIIDDSTSSSFTDNCEPVQVSVTTWNQITIKVLLPSVFDMEELLTALSTKLQSKRCAGCPICRLQKSSMEVWIVTANGIGHKLDSDNGTFDVSKHGKHFYLLEHEHKLLIIYFEDGTFQVIPCLASIKAKEVPYLPIFADKLSSLGFNNFGLFLVNEKGTSFPFSPEEEPLKHSFQGRLMLKNRALTISPPVSSGNLEIQGHRLRKNQQNRMNQKALKIVEKEKCKHFQLRNTSKEGFSPPDGLVFTNEYYGISGELNRPSALTDSIEHTESIQETADGENGSTELRSSVENCSISQEGESGTDELVPNEQTTERGSPEKCLNEFSEVSVGIATRFRKGSDPLDKHSSTLITDPSLIGQHMSIVQGKEDLLKHSDNFAENGGSSEQTEESTKIESADFHRKGSLSSGCETWETNEPESTDDSRGRAAAASASCDEDAGVEHNLRVSELVSCANKTSTFGDETSIEKETIEHASNEEKQAEANKEMAAQNTGSENHTETEIPGTASSDAVTSSAQDETRSDKRKRTENLARPGTDSVGSTEIHEHFRSRSALVDKWTDGPCSSCVCHELLPVECDYTIISSPRVLKVVLRACSGRKANEEEVGEANKFSRICLSGWHLQCENGSWIVVEQGRSHSDCDTPAIKIQLSERLDAFFHKEERLWTVKESEHVANEPEDVKNQIQNQDVSDVFAGTEESSHDVTPQDQSVTSDLSKRNAHQDLSVTFSGDEAQEVAKTSFGTRKTPGSCTVVANSRAECPNQRALHSAIQEIFEKMNPLRRSVKDALGNTKHETIIEIICKSLCGALWDLLSVGLRKRFIGKYTVWHVVEEFKDVSSHVSQTVVWVNTKYVLLDETRKFQALVCECLTIGHGTLHQWLKGLFRQNEKKLNKYYNQDGIVFHLSREKKEELVSDLSRISSLRFDLNFESWIRAQGYDPNKAAFAFE